jgi:ABC-2 type transport system ATP-binding protein
MVEEAVTMNNIAIEARALTKAYGKKVALQDFSMRISEPGITGLLGRNGAGKTTLMRLYAGLLEKSSGNVVIWGEDPLNNLRALERLIYSYHDLTYSPGLSLQTILDDYQSFYPTFDPHFAQGLLSYFDLDQKKHYAGLSQGTKSVFNFLCAMASRAPLTMLDEPTLGMDISARKAVYEILLDEFNHNPRVFFISSHLIAELEPTLNSAVIIDKGKLLLHSSIEDMRQSAYQIQGDEQAVTLFSTDKQVIHREVGDIHSTAVIYESASEEIAQEAATVGLRLSAVPIEDLYLYLTNDRKGGDLSCLR